MCGRNTLLTSFVLGNHECSSHSTQLEYEYTVGEWDYKRGGVITLRGMFRLEFWLEFQLGFRMGGARTCKKGL